MAMHPKSRFSVCDLLAFCYEAWEGLGKLSIGNRREITLMSVGMIQQVMHHIDLTIMMGPSLETKAAPP